MGLCEAKLQEDDDVGGYKAKNLWGKGGVRRLVLMKYRAQGLSRVCPAAEAKEKGRLWNERCQACEAERKGSPRERIIFLVRVNLFDAQGL